MERLRVAVRGIVQGVGFRPYIYRLATELKLKGWVGNSPQGVILELEGNRCSLETFLSRLEPEKPAPASLQSVEPTWLDAVGYADFCIRESETTGEKRTLILPDLAICPECLRELFDPTNRRYRYPFINCTYCGPRFSIIEGLPYDRPQTTMKHFALCPECRQEYESPVDRRFHAQPNACPICGPHVEFWDTQGCILAERDAALRETVEAIRAGQIVAVQGLGGFHLLVDARNEEAVHRLRTRKRREEKPLAVMYPTLEQAARDCHLSEREARLLGSPQAPIVLLRKRSMQGLAPSVAPGNPNLGVMLPYTPLHHLLLRELDFPVVATSGNFSEEPICTEPLEALSRLNSIADRFLVHNRPIARHVDDSVARVMLGREMILRRARGYAPLPITLTEEMPVTLAVGAHLKNAVALSIGKEAFLSQHIGDLETAEAYNAFQRVASELQQLYDVQPETVVCDLHPNYLSTQYAEKCGLPLQYVQHHEAHVLSCMAENDLKENALGVSWDGTGYGRDGMIWGGEFFHVTSQGITRAAHLRPFPLLGGEKAIREPRRTAIGLLYALYGEDLFTQENSLALSSFSPVERKTLALALGRRINTPLTTSAGRLFDAFAALAGIRQTVAYEGQAAIEWEACAAEVETSEAYPLPILRFTVDAPLQLDWGPMLNCFLKDLREGVSVGILSARFHNALVEGVVRVSHAVGEERVVLTGGCFLNARLLERAVHRLREEGFRPYWHQRVPPGDGGIALGQLAYHARFGAMPESLTSTSSKEERSQ